MPLDTDVSIHYLVNPLIDGFENRVCQESGLRKVWVFRMLTEFDGKMLL
jgi:hypothetical protein